MQRARSKVEGKQRLVSGVGESPCSISVADLWTYRVADTGGTEREPLRVRLT